MRPEPVICVIGLGYVGLPLAAAFGRTSWKTYGFDINAKRVDALRKGHDATGELSDDDLKKTSVEYSVDPEVIRRANTIIVAVPTPVDARNKPDLTPVIKASETVGRHLSKGAVVAYESTVYPGVTEDICVPILERGSGLRCGTDFTVGYSPERINPGDKEHTIDKIVKVVAGQDEPTLQWLAMVYGKIVPAGIHRAKNIKVAELAKALENTQRDINIALMNEVAQFCSLLGIRTADVLKAAGTKWNFLKFQPGLVGGHCIGVDPYYLVEKAKMLGMKTQVISAGRVMNDGMADFVAKTLKKGLESQKKKVKGSRILVLGLTFKENIPDTRNAKVHDVIRLLEKAGCSVLGHDPHLTSEEIRALGFTPGSMDDGPFDAVLFAVPHREYTEMLTPELIQHQTSGGVFFDLKSLYSPEVVGESALYLSL